MNSIANTFKIIRNPDKEAFRLISAYPESNWAYVIASYIPGCHVVVLEVMEWNPLRESEIDRTKRMRFGVYQ